MNKKSLPNQPDMIGVPKDTLSNPLPECNKGKALETALERRIREIEENKIIEIDRAKQLDIEM